MRSQRLKIVWLVLIGLLGACKPTDSSVAPGLPPPRPTAEVLQGPPEDAVSSPTPAMASEPAPSPEPRGAASATPPARTKGETNVVTAGLVEYELRLDRAAYRRLSDSPFENETCPAVFLAGDERFEGARVRHRGQWARSWPKKPLKILLPKETPYLGYTALNLNSAWHDPALIREVLAYHVYAACGAPAPRARMVRLIINGQFEGLYVDVEQPKRQFLKRIGAPKAAIYKALGYSNTSDERDLGSLDRYAEHYEKETRESEGFDELQKFCHGLATASDITAFFDQNVDVDRLVNYLAAGALVQNWDCFNKNHHLVHDVGGSGKWFPTPWDVDRTFGDHWSWSFDAFDLPALLGTQRFPGVTGWNRMAEKFLAHPAYRSRFLDRLEVLIQTEFTPEKLYPIIDRWAAQMAGDVTVDRARWGGEGSSFNAGIVQLKVYIERRRTFLGREITALRKREAGRPRTPSR